MDGAYEEGSTAVVGKAGGDLDVLTTNQHHGQYVREVSTTGSLVEDVGVLPGI